MANGVGPGAATEAPMTPEELAAFNEFNNTTLQGRDFWAKNPVTGEPGAWHWINSMGWVNAAPDLRTLTKSTSDVRDKYWWKSPDASWTMAGMYGNNPTEAVNPEAAFANPDWAGGQQGKPVGGIGGTTGMGQMIYYNAPQTWQATKQGQLIETPAGNYKAYYNTSLGQWVLKAEEGAASSGISPWVYSYTGREGHIGINPFTGEIWYQSVKNAPNAGWGEVDENYDAFAGTDRDTSSAGTSQQTTSSTAGTTGTSGGTGTAGTTSTTGTTTGTTDTAGTTSTAAATSGITGSMGASAGYSPSTPLSIGFNLPNLTSTTTQGGIDYVAALNNMLITDVMGGMFTGRGRA